MKERNIKTFFVLLALFMSASLLYGGYKVHREADQKSAYEGAAREKAILVNMGICEEIQSGSFQSGSRIKDPLKFLRVCAEELN